MSILTCFLSILLKLHMLLHLPSSLLTGETGREMLGQLRHFKENAGVLQFKNNIII